MRLLILTSLLLVGCSLPVRTPAQDRTWAQVAACGRNTLNVTVAADGSWKGNGPIDPDNRAFVACMRGRW